MKRFALLPLLVAAFAVRGDAYLKFGAEVGGRFVMPTWASLPVRYFVTDRGVPGVSPGDLQLALQRATQTWQAVPTASITFQFAGFTGAEPSDFDGISTLGFLSRPELERVLGATEFLIDRSGALVEADIFFNAAFPWSVRQTGEPGRFDLESIALHEIGHLLGLGHSGIGETELQGDGRRVLGAGAVMFPIAFSAGNIDDRALQPDDVAGVSDLYPDGDFRRRTGSISGVVMKAGRGVFGAHVTAFHLATGKLVGGFTQNDEGGFAIAGLEPGPHLVRVEPLDDGEIESFFTDTSSVDVDFRARYLDRLAIVPSGGDAGRIAIEVVPK